MYWTALTLRTEIAADMRRQERRRGWNEIPPFAAPIVREVPRPAGRDQFAPERW
jgi:hypothetical protein